MKEDIHYILTDWGKWRTNRDDRDFERAACDSKPEFGPRIPKGVPQWQTPRAVIYSYWAISEIYDRWPAENVLRCCVKLTYLQPVELGVSAICQALGVHPSAYTQYLSKAKRELKQAASEAAKPRQRDAA